MEWLDYHHLLYSRVVAKEGTIAAACKELNLAQPTISAQLRVAADSRGELEDSAFLKVFGQAGVGLFAAPTVIEKAVQRRYTVRVVGRLESVPERFYAKSVEKTVEHPAVLAIADEAR